ncbi:hypothetical protein O181_055296 [Austropuccinia psidii MF-1]|uniref:RRM domain-containing protein n=1 Tax=Austropuccinia psidii MF-1 TaxID=1389203 RepID=A0A9Q3E452_9BASI|nr:hypothetical protein [Austropuccinia psidii MF-1]
MSYNYSNSRNNLTNSLSERDKMLSGRPYLATLDPQLVKDRLRVRPLIQKYNSYPWPTNEADDPEPDYFGPDDRRLVLAELFGLQLDDIKHKPIEIEPPFYCDYGHNIIFKGPFYTNFNCHILDCAMVTLGSRVMFGPNVHIYAATHGTDIQERQKGLERAYPVTVGDDVWVGGGAIIVGPCNIGNGTTVAAGALVKGDIPANVVIAGVPGRIVKHLTPVKPENSNSKFDADHSASNPKASHLTRSSAFNATTSYKAKLPLPLQQSAKHPTPRTSNPEEEVGQGYSASKESEATIDPTTECFLANIPPRLSHLTLQTALSIYGEVQSLTMDRNRRLGFVRFDSAQAAEEAVEAGRGPDGLTIIVDNETKEKMVVGIERRRVNEGSRTFNPDLVTSTRCMIRRVPNTVNFDELRNLIEERAGRLVNWDVQDFASPDPTKPTTDKFIALEFEQLCGSREAVRLSQSADNGTEGGLEVPGADGLKVRIEARKQYSPPQLNNNRSNYRGSYHHHPSTQRGSFGYHSRGGAPSRFGATGYNHHNHYQSHQNHYHHHHSKPFNGSLTKWKPRRGSPFFGSQE